jgi:hypothetical protein
MMYDVVIIGGGIAGLYAAYNIKRFLPTTTFIILEKERKQRLGGRAGNEMFCGTEIVTGAGIGRRKKDVLLHRLLKEFSIETPEFIVEPKYSRTITQLSDIPKIMDELKKKYNSDKPETFKTFAKSILGEKEYENFLITSGYTDYENEDAHDVLYHYGMEDNSTKFTGFHVAWKTLVSKMAEMIGPEHFVFSSKIVALSKIVSENRFEVYTGSNDFSAKKVIIATTISSIRLLLPDFHIYKEIEGQPFLRVYGKFDKKSVNIINQFMKGTTIVPGPLQKIIPIDADKGIYMIAYSDNKNAEFLKTHLENTAQNRHFFCQLIEESLGIQKDSLKLLTMKHFYWDIGTHYYKPLEKYYKTRAEFIEKAQHPDKNVMIVGEALSFQQGWTEGALESVVGRQNKPTAKSAVIRFCLD